MDNQFASDNQVCCPYFERMGVCLEPAACFLKHKTMNVNAKEFIPNFGPPVENDPSQIQSSPVDVGAEAARNYEKALKEVRMHGELEGIEGMEQMIYKVDSR